MNIIRPKVGIGVLVIKDGKTLLGKRMNAHGASTWAPPGGHLEMGEAWETCARREVMEEAGIEIKNVRFFAVTNDIHEEESKHYVTIFLQSDYASGEVQTMEPHKCSGWEWFKWESLPAPRFKPLDTVIRRGYHPLCKRHDKLVRDKIIEIIEANGEKANWYTADIKEHKQRLKTKLAEEVYEYIESESPEELADILEVIHSLTALQGMPREQLKIIQKEKRDERGGFEKRTILTDTTG